VYVLAVFSKSRTRGFGRTSTPRELGGSNGRGSNSEQLFAAAFTSSFLGVPRLVAARAGIAFPPDAVIRHSSGTPDLFAGAAALRGRRASGQGARPVPERHAITSLLGRSLPEDAVDAQSTAR
jgi:hypothetical protein